MQKSFRDHNLELAIFLSYRNPQEGGGFTITDDLLNCILKKYKKKKIIFILLNDHQEKLKNKINKAGFKCESFYENKNLLKIKNIIFCIFPLLLKIYNLMNLNSFLNFQKKINFKIVWFLSAEYYYPIFPNYISTVWDLQHITHSQFPENGNLIRKYYRGLVIKKFLENSCKIITGSNILIKLIKKEYKIQHKKFIYNKHPTPTTFITTKKKNKRVKSLYNYFLYPANFWQHKNHKNLFAGFKKFNQKNQNKFKLILVGDVKDKSYYKNLINVFNNDFKKNFLILNFVKLNKLIELYDNSLAIIYASYAGPENLPPLEGMARKKTIICSNYPGAKEQLKNIPIYFDPKSTKSIELALDKFLKNKNKNNFIIRHAYKYIEKVLNTLEYD